jgi:hypothetical protein
MSPQRREPDGSRQVGPSWESLVERQIRQAMDDGAFDDLPHAGARLPLEDDAAAGEWAMAFRILRNAGVAPPWIEADKEVRTHLAALERLLDRAVVLTPAARGRLRREAAAMVDAANRAIARLNAEAPTDRLHRRPLDRDEVLDRLR